VNNRLLFKPNQLELMLEIVPSLRITFNSPPFR